MHIASFLLLPLYPPASSCLFAPPSSNPHTHSIQTIASILCVFVCVCVCVCV